VFSPADRTLAFDDSYPGDIWLLPIADHNAARPLLQTPFREWGPRFSSDGHCLAYLSDESARFEVYVRPYPEPGGKWQVSTEGANEPAWAGNGREIFYRAGDRMMAVRVETQPTFSASKPQLLFDGKYEPGFPGLSNYDVTPDGQRFVMVQARERESVATQINVVLNWSGR
jgi:serine/threonine-protein kinase